MVHLARGTTEPHPRGSESLGAGFFPVLLLLLLMAAGVPAWGQTDCAECHENVPEAFADTVHGFLDCTDCHAGQEELPHPEAGEGVDCAVCHDDVAEAYRASVHGQTRMNGATEAPDCAACHGAVHQLVPGTDSGSPVSDARLAQTCGSCHADPEMVEKFGIPWAQPLEAYEASVHAVALANGEDAPTCGDCHGNHAIFPGWDTRSLVYHQRVPDTCGTCHQEIAATYSVSVHGKAAAKGIRESPVCTDCHGEHRILSPTESGSPVYASNLPKMTCERCHADLRLTEKFGLGKNKVSAYQDSYHGLASRSGVTTVASCSSCHGVHDILPSSDPASHIHADNLAGTCGRCHPGAGKSFAIGKVHVLPTEREHLAIFYVRQLYLALIFVSIGGMIAHNLADFYRKIVHPPRRPAEGSANGEVRMSLGFRIAHGLMGTSFICLVYTGFALKYPESWWAQPLLVWEDSLGLRGWLHRSGALVMIAALVFHLVHLAMDRRARRCIAGMLPRLEDWHEFRERLRYFAGRRPEPPPSPRLGYPEKMEYIALMWGSLVMIATGLVLWFETPALRWLPTWVMDVSTVIHFYEAILASLAILVWHFYFVIFDPVVYPVDTAWLTGRAAPGRALERQTHDHESA